MVLASQTLRPLNVFYKGDIMKTKKYSYGKFHFNAYYKTAGHGYEIGLTYGKKTIFVGNFIHQEDANKWWTTLNSETTKFAKKYWVNDDVSTTWYCHFFSSHLYKSYYTFLDKCFTKYTSSYSAAFKRDSRRYQKLQRNWDRTESPKFRAA